MKEMVQFEDEKPDAPGYYYILYEHKDGNTYGKAVWWNDAEFRYKDYVKRVISYIPERFDFYVPCMMAAEGGVNEQIPKSNTAVPRPG